MGHEAPKKRPSERSVFSRRDMIVGGLAALSIGANVIQQKVVGVDGDKRREIQNDSTPETIENQEGRAVEFPTGPLAGKKMQGLFALYLGVKSGTKLGRTVKLDYAAALDRSIALKKKTWGKRLAQREKKLDTGMMQQARLRSADYRDHWDSWDKTDENGNQRFESLAEAVGQTRLADVSKSIEAVALQVTNTIDAEGLQDKYGATYTEMSAVANLAKRIDGDMMLAAYAMTEMFPGSNGVYNAQFLDFWLQTGGKESVANQPSQGDAMDSWGPFQFTPWAFGYRNENGKRIANGASRLNELMPPNDRLPDELGELSFEQHFKAGHLFALDNLLTVATRLPEWQLARFANMPDEALLGYMATSHNNPQRAREALKYYLSDPTGKLTFRESCARFDAIHYKKATEGKSKEEKKKVIFVYLSNYADKTIKNHKGLKKYLSQMS